MGRPPHVGSLPPTSSWAAPAVASVTVLEYQPVRVFTSVLFSPQAPTLVTASIGPGSGIGQSSCQTYLSRPPCPVSTIAFITPLIQRLPRQCSASAAGSRNRRPAGPQRAVRGSPIIVTSSSNPGPVQWQTRLSIPDSRRGASPSPASTTCRATLQSNACRRFVRWALRQNMHQQRTAARRTPLPPRPRRPEPQ